MHYYYAQLQPNSYTQQYTYRHGEEVNINIYNPIQLHKQVSSAQCHHWAARQPARLRVGLADAPGWTFNRRQIYETDMGQQVGTQGPEWVENSMRRMR